jgi:hypothetical protein
MEYAIYPFDYMRITQRHDQGNHLAHWNPFKDYADKPWDEACKDGGRSYFIPQNDYVIDAVIIGNRSLILSTTEKVKIPYQEEPVILHITLTHMKEEDLRKLKVGQIVKKGTKLILEGDEGGAYGYHFHCTANIGNYYGIKQNSNGKWCFVYDKSLLPNEAFYVDPNFTHIINSNGYTFQYLPVLMQKGDTGEDIEKICDFLSNKVKGNYYGDYCEACVAVYKKQHGISGDGSTIDSQTLESMKKEGLNV